MINEIGVDVNRSFFALALTAYAIVELLFQKRCQCCMGTWYEGSYLLYSPASVATGRHVYTCRARVRNKIDRIADS